MANKPKSDIGGEHLRRLRRICTAMPEATEKLSHGEPTFFARKKVFAMFANNHHNDGHIAVWNHAARGKKGSRSFVDQASAQYHLVLGLQWWSGPLACHTGI